MTGPTEGAVTTQDGEPLDPSTLQASERPTPPASERPPQPERPPRPVLVELGSAILIVGGVTAIIGGVLALVFGPNLPAGAGLPPLVLIALNVVGIATGLLVRNGRAWRVCINIVAVTIFLYLTALPNPLAVFYLSLDAIVFYGLVRHRAWFDWHPSQPSVAA